MKSKTGICLDCETITDGKKRSGGSFAMEIFLWVFTLPLGIIYSLWRFVFKKPTCECCGSNRIVPIQSPAAVAILNKRKIA